MPADVFTLNYRRSFNELMNRVKDDGHVNGASR